MRPIDADQIIYTWVHDPYGKEHDGVTLQSIIESMPTIELPDIIHCKDCKHCIREDYDVHTPYGFYDTVISAFCDLHWKREEGEYRNINLDDYCAWAERRTDGQT